MKREAMECLTLGEYREQVLRISQRELARLAGCQQAWISAVERGHLPKPRNWDRLLRAYRLDGENGERQFERMVRTARQLVSLSLPLGEELPLWALYGESKPPCIEDLPSLPLDPKVRQA